jgi:hypothetical protein
MSPRPHPALLSRVVRLFAILRTYGLVALWVVTVVAMAVNAVLDPFDPARVDTSAYGHNHRGAFWDGLLVTAVEGAVLYLLLQPWKRRRSPLRLIAALVLLVPWTLLSALSTMHAGSIVALHFFWLVLVDVAVCVALAISVVGRFTSKSV